MLTLRRDKERQHVKRGKNGTWQTFHPRAPSPFASAFGALVLLNEVRLAPGEGSASSPRGEAEIVTYAYKGALSQESSAGSSGVLTAGEFQLRTTGRRIRYKARNASATDWVHVFQIFLRPSELGLDPAYEQRRFTLAQRHNLPCVIASPDGQRGLWVPETMAAEFRKVWPGRETCSRLTHRHLKMAASRPSG